MAYSFNAENAAKACIKWIQDWFEENGRGCSAVIGISGGKDSSTVAALCARALGSDRVIGVLMPQGDQFDIDYSYELCRLLGIKHYVVNIKDAVDALKASIPLELSTQAATNIPPRVRMTVLYAVAQCCNGRVANTCNLSEDWVGYSTRYGDAAGDFGAISHFTVQEVKAIARYLGLPERFVEKPPIDGLCGKTDEDNLGFTYAELDAYIREGKEPPHEKKEKIDRLNRLNSFKLKHFDTFDYSPD